jgi:hypothetical protein
MTDPIEIMARALWNGREAEFPKLARMEWDKGTDLARAATIRHAKAFVTALADAGFAIVPVTPTEPMRNAGSDIGEWGDNLPPQTMPWAAADVYRAMIEAGRVKA